MKYISLVAIALLFLLSFSGCATVFGGEVTACQRRKPAPGEPQRQVRVVPMIADILIFPPSLIVDFATGAIYKPCGTR